MARLVLSAIFALAGFGKLVDRAGTRRAVRDFGVPEATAGPAAFLLPLAELAVAAALLPASTAWWGGLSALGLLLLFVMGISVNLIQGHTPDCHCFGQIHSKPVGPSTLIRNTVLAGIAAFIVAFGRSSSEPSAVEWLRHLAPEQTATLGAALVICVLFAVFGWVLLGLIQQNGRLVARLEGIEARLDLAPGAPRPGLIVGAHGPSFDLPDLDGNRVTLDDLRSRGRPVFLFMSDPGCESCMALMPEIARWQRQLASALTVAVVSRGTPNENRVKAAEYGATSVLLQETAEVFQSYKLTATPSAVLVQADGTIGSVLAVGAEEIRALVSRTLAQKPPIALQKALRRSNPVQKNRSGLMLTVGDVIDATGATAVLEPGTADISSVRAMSVSGVVEAGRLGAPGALVAVLPDEPQDAQDHVAEAYVRGSLAALTPIALHISDERRAVRHALAGSSEAFASLVVPDVLEALRRSARAWRSVHQETTVIGITGSIGKSSTREAVASLLSGMMPTLSSSSSHNDDLGVALTLLRLRQDHRAAVLEMGMHAPGQVAALATIASPTIGIVTGVAPVHLSRLGSIEAIASAKAELVQLLPDDGVAILNGDDARVRQMAQDTQARVEFFGLGPDNDWRATEIENQGLEGMAFTIERNGWKTRVETPIVGRHFLYALLSAAAVGAALGISKEDLASLLHDVRIQDRQLVIRGANDLVIIDDTWNASPPSMLAALDVLNTAPHRRVAVLGEMLELGEETEQAHRDVGRRAGEVADVVVAVGPAAVPLAEGARDAGIPADRVVVVESHVDGVQALKTIVQPGDSILVKGSRGVHLEHVVHWLLGQVPSDDHDGSTGVSGALRAAETQSLGALS